MTSGAIACFHSVTMAALPSSGSAHVTVDAFKLFIRVARALGEVVPLSELVARHQQGRSTAGLVAVTFDDAYAAILTELKDFIAAQGLPVTIFAVTDAAARGARFWWDRIEDLFPHVGRERWMEFENACGLSDAYRRGQPVAHGPLRPLRQWLLAADAGRWSEVLEPALQALERETGRRTAHRAMTFEELAALASLPEVEIGVHTMSHPVLPLLGDSELRHEIEGAHEILRARFARVLPMLAIPFGLFDRRTLRIARAAGMAASFTLAGTRHEPGVDSDALPRICLTRDDSAVRFGVRLLGVPDLVRSWSRQRPAPYPELPSATS